MTTTAVTDTWLEQGDNLTREEFHRRYEARSDIRKAELIRGVVFVPSPTRAREHGKQHGISVYWLSSYIMLHPVAEVYDNTTLYLDKDTEVQPDAFLARFDGSPALLNDEGYMEGPPELVLEVSASSASYDLHQKLDIYRDAGVQEYIVWRVLDDAIDWFRLRDGRYVPLQPDADGIIHSEVFPGLRLAVQAMLAFDRKTLSDLLARQTPQ